MPAAPLPADETRRHDALLTLDVLDTEPEEEFDALVRAAAAICATPISLISLVDSERQWFKASIGLDTVTETPRDLAFCAHAILDDGLLEVPDATRDTRFADNLLVTEGPGIRFYAGMPLRLSDGARVGTLCVIDRTPRRLTAEQREVLEHLAVAAARALEGRRARRQEQQLVAELKASEARFCRLYESAPAMLQSVDMAGHLLSVSDQWLRVLGYSRDAALGRIWSDFLTPESRARLRDAAIPRFYADGHCDEVEFQMVTQSGALLDVLVSAVMERDFDGDCFRSVMVIEDITQRRQVERALRNSERFLDRTGRLAGIGGWEVDLASQAVMWSTEMFRIYGLEPGPAPSLATAMAGMVPESRALLDTAIAGAIAGGPGWDMELQLMRRDGKVIWVDASGHCEFEEGRPVRLVGALQDITDRVAARTDLERLNTRMSLAADSGGIGIWDCDPARRTIVCDEWMHRQFGLEPGLASGELGHWVDCFHADDREVAERVLADAVAGAGTLDTELRVVLPDGGIRHLRMTARATAGEGEQGPRIVGVSWDVTKLRELTAALDEQRELLEVTLQSIDDAVITTDRAGNVSWLNPAAERMTGWANGQAAGRALATVFRIVDEETMAPLENPVAACVERREVVRSSGHSLLVSRSGEKFSVEESAAPIRSGRGEVLGVVLVFHDVTEQRRLSGEMTYRATHDPLTGLVNRGEFEARLRRVFAQAQAERGEHALMYIDLDQFKLVNDACGHAVGDLLLLQVSKLLTAAVRGSDTVARLGGDEFALILEGCTGEQAQRIGKQICDRMDEFRFIHDGQSFRVGTSIGLVMVNANWTSTAAIVQAADTACRTAKESGRNRVHTWLESDLAMQARQGETRWATRLEQALDTDRFTLFAQRIVALEGDAAGIHAEVLLRMRETDGSLVEPGAFLPAAERFHLASRIDRWVLRNVIQWFGTLSDPARIGTMSVNLSGQSIGDRAFHRHVMEVLEQAGDAICSRLCLEITETSAITNLEDAATFIHQVRALGVRIALDDFGAGASSFGYLKNLPVDYLKIDGQFIRDLVEDTLDDAAVRCFADVARVIGVKTVAEFVDRPAVLARLRDIGIDYAQGFLLHRPEPLAALLMDDRGTSIHCFAAGRRRARMAG